ncbi:hypothetical protein MNV49_003396 [Pseudohyphozyma bogoriensis]|nr:hypothetical protein MNV49_003396 [Pseudohyphozyma bogoriensis]
MGGGQSTAQSYFDACTTQSLTMFCATATTSSDCCTICQVDPITGPGTNVNVTFVALFNLIILGITEFQAAFVPLMVLSGVPTVLAASLAELGTFYVSRPTLDTPKAADVASGVRKGFRPGRVSPTTGREHPADHFIRMKKHKLPDGELHEYIYQRGLVGANRPYLPYVVHYAYTFHLLLWMVIFGWVYAADHDNYLLPKCNTQRTELQHLKLATGIFSVVFIAIAIFFWVCMGFAIRQRNRIRDHAGNLVYANSDALELLGTDPWDFSQTSNCVVIFTPFVVAGRAVFENLTYHKKRIAALVQATSHHIPIMPSRQKIERSPGVPPPNFSRPYPPSSHTQSQEPLQTETRRRTKSRRDGEAGGSDRVEPSHSGMGYSHRVGGHAG